MASHFIYEEYRSAFIVEYLILTQQIVSMHKILWKKVKKYIFWTNSRYPQKIPVYSGNVADSS